MLLAEDSETVNVMGTGEEAADVGPTTLPVGLYKYPFAPLY